MRGLPGSGKSTEARILAGQHIADGGRSVAVLSTDDYHMIDGKYVFQPEKLGEYHMMNQEHAVELMDSWVELVVIDNTNIKRRDMKPYINAGERNGYDIEQRIIGEEYLVPAEEMTQQLVDGYIKLCAKRNTHGVPLEAISRMARNFQK